MNRHFAINSKKLNIEAIFKFFIKIYRWVFLKFFLKECCCAKKELSLFNFS